MQVYQVVSRKFLQKNYNAIASGEFSNIKGFILKIRA